MTGSRSAQRALFVLLLGALLLVLATMRPFAEALFLAAVLAMVLYPVHRRFSRLLRGRERVSAVLLVIGVVLLILGPLVGFSAFLVREAADASRYVSKVLRDEGTAGLVERLPDGIEKRARSLLARLPKDSLEDLSNSLQQRAAGAGGTALGAVGTAVSTTGTLVFQTIMMLLALFFFVRNKEGILTFIDDASPLRKGQTRELLDEFRRVARAVLFSSAITAFVQAVAAVIGYYIAGVPYPVFFGALTFFIAFIPAVGAASVVLVAAALQLVTGHPISAAFLAGWGILVVGLVDNVVKPLILRSGMQLHGAVVFFALLGGLSAFGTIGLVLGPLAVALFLALLRIYQRDYAEDPRDREAARRRSPGEPEPNEQARGDERTGLHS